MNMLISHSPDPSKPDGTSGNFNVVVSPDVLSKA